MSFAEEWKTRTKISMSERVGKILKEIQATACVHVEEREIIAWCKIYGIISPEDEEFIQFLNEVAIPAFTELGRQRWYRDTITDLGLALSGESKTPLTEDTRDILESVGRDRSEKEKG